MALSPLVLIRIDESIYIEPTIIPCEILDKVLRRYPAKRGQIYFSLCSRAGVNGQGENKSVPFLRPLSSPDVDIQKGIEYKMGYQTATQSNLWEVARDKVLVDQGWQVEWVFRDQASKPLLEALEKAGISIKVGH